LGAIDESTLTMVWEPMFVPYRFPEVGERWFPPAVQANTSFHIPGDLIEIAPGQFLPARDVPIHFATDNIPPPTRNLANSTLGLRAGGLAGGVDFALYYFHGFDIAPAFRLLVDAVATPNPADPLGVDVVADTRLQPAFASVDAVGADSAYTFGPVTVRAEAAFIDGRPFPRDLRRLVTDPSQLKDQVTKALLAFQGGATTVPIDPGPSFVERDAVDWGIGADTTYEGWFALLQVSQTDVLHNDTELLIKNFETRFMANVRRNFWQDRVQGQVLALYGLESDYTALMPRVDWFITDTVDVRVGYLFIAGRESSTIGQYKENDQGFVRMRLTF
jgi:hypothetical protein